jgi:hypothetical protein
MSPAEQEQIQHVIQAAHSISQKEEAKLLLEPIDVRLYSQIFKAALSAIYEQSQPINYGIRELVWHLENSPAPYTAEDIRAILQLFNNLLKLMSSVEMIIFPLPPAFEPYLIQPEVFALCQSEIVACYWAAYHWSQRFNTTADQYRQLLLVGDALLGDDQPGVPGLLRRYTKGGSLPLAKQAQEFLSVYDQEFRNRIWLYQNHDVKERMRQAINAPLKVRIIRAALAKMFGCASLDDYDPAYAVYAALIDTLSSDSLPGTVEDIQDISRKIKARWQNCKIGSLANPTFYNLLVALSPCLLLPETLEPCRADIEALYHLFANIHWSVSDSQENRIRLLLRQILFPTSAGPLMDCLQASSSSFVTDHDAQTLLQAYHQEYANGSIDKLDPPFARLFKQKLSPHFTIRLILLAIQENQSGHVSTTTARQNIVLVKALCKKELPFTPDDIHAILDAAKNPTVIEGGQFYLFLIKAFAPHLRTPAALEQCRVDLEELQALAPSLGWWDTKTQRTYLLMLSDLLSARQQTISYPLLPDAWATPIIDELMALDATQQVAWTTLLHHCASATGKAPSTAWLEQAQSLIEPIGNDSFTRTVHRWISLFSDKKGERMDGTNSTILRGLIWLCTGSADHSLANILADAAIEGYRKIPGLGPRSPKVGEAAVTTLAHMPGMQAIGQLERVRLHVKQPSYQKGIEQALDEVARREQMSRTDLEELTVPTFDLQHGQAQFSFGSWSAHLSLNGRTVRLRWFDQNGKELKSVPAQVKKTYKEEYKDLKRRVDDIEHLLSTQRLRMERFYLAERHWPLQAWQERYLHHPLLHTLSRRLIWQFRLAEQSLQGIWYEGRLVDVNNQPLELPAQTEVSLWHPLMSSAQEVQRWRLWLEEHLITQPFKQAHREVYPLTDAERAAGDTSRRFAGHFIRQHQLNALAPARGWTFSLQYNFSGSIQEDPARLELPNLGVRAEWGLHLDSDHEQDIPPYVLTSWVRFPLANASYPIPLTPLEQIPPIIFSEVMRDVDLFVSVSSAGTDPYGNNEPGEIGRYWHSYNQSELSLSAMERKNVLERLVPRLTIAERCTFDGNFLIVHGDLCTYHIHLGSGNIQMEPDNRYLCIVSDSRQLAYEGQFFLPFEGDVLLSLILSKAFLLAEDKQIKDPSILSQILS